MVGEEVIAEWVNLGEEYELQTIQKFVRCKDCKYHNTHRCFMAFDMVATEDNGYCYMGERKDHE